MSKTWILTMPLGGFTLFGKGYAHGKSLFRGLIPVVTVATVTKDIAGFRLPFAIGAAIIAVFLSVAAATRMGTLFWCFHALCIAFRVPTLLGLPNLPKTGPSESGRGPRFWDLGLASLGWFWRQ